MCHIGWCYIWTGPQESTGYHHLDKVHFLDPRRTGPPESATESVEEIQRFIYNLPVTFILKPPQSAGTVAFAK
jgi:hypothetical protein